MGAEIVNIGGNKRGENFDTSTSFPIGLFDQIVSKINPPHSPPPRSAPVPLPAPILVPVPTPTVPA